MTVTQILIGPREHGVVRFGAALHRYLDEQGVGIGQRWSADAASVTSPAEIEDLHLQFTDHLFGDCPRDAAEAVGALRHHARILTATLHDLPQLSDGARRTDRVTAYAAVARMCDGIVVSSEHERKLLHDNAIDCRHVEVIPLPIDRCDPAGPGPAPAVPVVGVFGFLYPGKGHAEVLAAVAHLPSAVEMHAIGAASTGHDDLLADLRARARRCRRVFHVTGHVADRDLRAVLRRVSVPVVAHRHISASGSINSWLGAGRRPVAVTNRYTTEFSARNPGTLALYPDTSEGLRSALARALAEPDSTWLAPECALTPTPAAAAQHYHRFFGAVAT